MYKHTHTPIQKTINQLHEKKTMNKTKTKSCINNCEISKHVLCTFILSANVYVVGHRCFLAFYAIYEYELLIESYIHPYRIVISTHRRSAFFRCGCMWLFVCVLLLLLVFCSVSFLVALSLTASWTNVMHIAMYSIRLSTTLQTNKMLNP